MFTDSGCLTTHCLPPVHPPLPLSNPSQPPQSNTHLRTHTHTATHMLTCSCRLSVATLLLPLSNFSLFPPICFTHMLTHTHMHTHKFFFNAFCSIGIVLWCHDVMIGKDHPFWSGSPEPCDPQVSAHTWKKKKIIPAKFTHIGWFMGCSPVGFSLLLLQAFDLFLRTCWRVLSQCLRSSRR